MVEPVFPKLLEAFQQDHMVLGRGFHELSCCLRTGDPAGACAAARRLYEEASAHIRFEEDDFYPALIPLLGEAAVRRMYQEHCCGFDAIHTLVGRGPDLPLLDDLAERLLVQTEIMEEHIAECGELFAALRQFPEAQQQALYEKLIGWRQHANTVWECRRPCCGALRLAQCHPAAIPAGAGQRSSMPVVNRIAVAIGADERRELTRLALRLIAEEPALITNDTLDPRTASGIENGPALFFEDHSDLSLHSSASFDYRARLLAGDGDIVLVGSQRRPEFEAYCRDRLGIGDPAVVVPQGPGKLPLTKRCAQDPHLRWNDSYPLLVGVWESTVVASPSVQLWIPHATMGAPLVEGIFEQIVDEGAFVGATPCALPSSDCLRLAREAVQVACLFQELGYFGRCSFDAVLLASGALHWIECNGRWGGVSIPMTLLNRLVGDWPTRAFVIVQQSGLRVPPRRFAAVIDRLQDRLFPCAGESRGILFLTADWIEQGTGFHFLVLGDSRDEVLAEGKNIARLLAEDSSCAGSMDSGRPN